MSILFNRHPIFCRCVCVTWLLLSFSAVADVLVVVSAKNATVTLNKTQVRDLFLGKTTSLPDGSNVTPIDQSETKPLREEFYTKVANMSASQVKARWAKLYFTGRGLPPREGIDSDEVKKLINSTPGAIGYIEQASLDSSVKVIFVAQ